MTTSTSHPGAPTPDRDLVLEQARVIAGDLRRFVLRDKPTERAERRCDRRPSPDLAVVGVVPAAAFVAAARQTDPERFCDEVWDVLRFAVAFELVGTGGAPSGVPDFTVAVGDALPGGSSASRILHSPGEGLVELLEDWYLYGPDYDTCDLIAGFVCDIVDVATAAFAVGALDDVVAILAGVSWRTDPPQRFARAPLPR